MSLTSVLRRRENGNMRKIQRINAYTFNGNKKT